MYIYNYWRSVITSVIWFFATPIHFSMLASLFFCFFLIAILLGIPCLKIMYKHEWQLNCEQENELCKEISVPDLQVLMWSGVTSLPWKETLSLHYCGFAVQSTRIHKRVVSKVQVWDVSIIIIKQKNPIHSSGCHFSFFMLSGLLHCITLCKK